MSHEDNIFKESVLSFHSVVMKVHGQTRTWTFHLPSDLLAPSKR